MSGLKSAKGVASCLAQDAVLQRALDAELEAQAWRENARRHRAKWRVQRKRAREAKEEAEAAEVARLEAVANEESARNAERAAAQLADTTERRRASEEASFKASLAAANKRIEELNAALEKRRDQTGALQVIASRLGLRERHDVELWRDVDSAVVKLLASLKMSKGEG